MARDFAKGRSAGVPARKKPAQQRGSGSSRAAPARHPVAQPNNGFRWYLAGLMSGVFACFLLYLYGLPAGDTPAIEPEPAAVATVAEPPKPRFDFYTMLPEQNIDTNVEPAEVADLPAGSVTETYLLQAGSFRQREDADRRRAELLLLGLDPKVEETNSDNGRWFRVYLGPFSSHPDMTRARSLTAAQDIDTLLLKRSAP